MENSGDESDHRFEDYSVSADVSESESCGASSFDSPIASTSTSTPPLFGSHSYLPVLSPVKLPGGKYASKDESQNVTEVQLMKDRFSKLLLGEDMTGRGNGVCTALAISNAITNLSATVFGDLWKLEPLSQQNKSMWRKEIEWLLSVSDSIVELTPSFQEFPEGGTFEVMVTRPRSDLYVNLPALKKLDVMLVTMLDGFNDSEFCYVDRGLAERHSNTSLSDSSLIQYEEKWWLPFPKVPPKGLSENTVKRLKQCRERSNQIFKAAASINGNVLSQMEVPKVYLDSLPKSAKVCLGETLHQYISTAQFSPESLLDYLEMSSECTTLQIANRIEAAMHIWTRKCTKTQGTAKLSWTGNVKGLSGDKDKKKVLAGRANTLLKNLKLQFPGLPRTTLDLDKIQSNKDVGQAILESYSRVIESVAFNLMARIDDLLYVDATTKKRVAAEASAANLRAKRPAMRGSSWSSMVTAPEFSPSPLTIRSRDKRRSSYSSTSHIDTMEEAFERLTFN
ncbi:rop guanine nucleotide exchange factor 1-like [Rutidosis leptorrhynchoides]|uniref:rop guanine nucleotide exchange factor 1-like n=1 Tax=Rutidosis leptorrhynchoides TaxID=125765 RepID=UPI003A99112B